MPVVPPSRIIRHLRGAALRQDRGGPDDTFLLRRFLAERDEAAFEALVRRHGPMVFSVCRRLLGRHHDAEDAFQATFLVLACRAATVRDGAALSSWLFAVAYRTAGRARARAARRFAKEREAAVSESFTENPGREDLARLLDLELSRLPEKYRAAILLCDLQGAPRKEAARQLGLPEGTLSSRLATARSMLARRLKHGGFALTVGGVAALIAENVASASVPVPLIGSTVQAAARVAAGQAVTVVATASVASLAKGVMNTMFMSKLKVPLGLVLAFGLMTLGWSAYDGTLAADDPPAAKELAKAPAPEPSAKDDSADDDVDLPVGTPLTQVRVRLDKNGKLVVKSAVRNGTHRATVPPDGGPSEPETTTIQIQRFDLAGVKVLDAKGKTVEESELARILKKETIAMASLHGEPIDPLHLRVLREGTLVFGLPAAKSGNNGAPTDTAPAHRSGRQPGADYNPQPSNLKPAEPQKR
jgi:RNA polymerase sigma factor (sigma-70 family)